MIGLKGTEKQLRWTLKKTAGGPDGVRMMIERKKGGNETETN